MYQLWKKSLKNIIVILLSIINYIIIYNFILVVIVVIIAGIIVYSIQGFNTTVPLQDSLILYILDGLKVLIKPSIVLSIFVLINFIIIKKNL